jgi:DNA invertase Pin-like site-specific DNA recombinase
MGKFEIEVIEATKSLVDRTKTQNVEFTRVAAYCRVSTMYEEQLDSYKTQIKHYNDLFAENPEWVKVDIYADEGITGTSTKNRTEFNRMINDCMNGEIDLVLTKSISRFARNTKDTLDYVRMLKEKGIAIIFEAENINTLTMNGEMLLTILSALSQQYVENLSEAVKFSLKAKMGEGVFIGRHDALGYDYSKETREITVNDDEAEIVKYIFKRYIEGAGGMIIGRELENLGYKTKKGSTHWGESTVLGIVKNEKYIGTLLQGKTFTADTMKKRRLGNKGESKQVRIRNRHEAIIDIETFEVAQAILKKRNENRTKVDAHGRREKYSKKYTFSCMLKCGYCGSNLSRRNWHSGTEHQKRVWHCVVATKKGKKYCPESKGIEETIIEGAFVQSYNLMCSGDNKEVLSEFLNRMEASLKDSSAEKQLSKVEKRIIELEAKNKILLENLLDGTISKSTYAEKKAELDDTLKELYEQKKELKASTTDDNVVRQRLEVFKRALESNEALAEFDKSVFEAVIERVIIGAHDDDGNAEPHKITFVYKTGLKSDVDGKKACSYTASDTCGNCCEDRKEIGWYQRI